MPAFTRNITDEQKKTLIENSKPAQDAINTAANDLIWMLMQRVEELETAAQNKPTVKSSVQVRKKS